jgi:hypothetical protein
MIALLKRLLETLFSCVFCKDFYFKPPVKETEVVQKEPLAYKKEVAIEQKNSKKEAVCVKNRRNVQKKLD